MTHKDQIRSPRIYFFRFPDEDEIDIAENVLITEGGVPKVCQPFVKVETLRLGSIILFCLIEIEMN